MNVTSATGAFISLADAETMAGDWISSQPTVNPANPKAHGFGKNKIQEILNQRDCIGLRMYNCLDSEGDKKLIIIGVDVNGDDIKTGLILDHSLPCPAECGSNSLA